LRSKLAAAFREPEIANSAKKSKSYEFSNLCLELARHADIKTLVAEAAQQNSIEAAAKFLADKFAEDNQSVAALARRYGRERSSGRHRQEKEPVNRPFLLLLQALVERAEKDGERIPFVESVKVLAPAAAQRDVFDLLVQLIPQATDDALPELINLIERRRARTQPHPA